MKILLEVLSLIDDFTIRKLRIYLATIKVKWQKLGSWEHFMRIHSDFCSLTFAKRAMKEDHSEQKYKSILKRIVRGVGILSK
jgi:hypothetical protein